MQLWVTWLCVIGAAVAGAQTQAPKFTAASVAPSNATRPVPLAPGALVSIYGLHLGPSQGCVGQNGPAGYPSELCGVKVTVAAVAAGLLYVQDRQVNLRVPATVSSEGLLDFIVTYNGVSSAPAPVRFAAQTATLSLAGAAYVHMPVWVEVQLPYPWHDAIRYPMDIWPGNFRGHELEVRRNGVILDRVHGSKPAFGIGGGPGSIGGIGGGGRIGLPGEPKHRGRLPLHLVYRFDQPGAYEVRYTAFDWRYPSTRHALVRSRWTRITIQPFSKGQRERWLEQQEQSVPQEPVELLSDYLPSVLALPDRRVLRFLESYLYHSNDLVRQYTLYSLYYFNDQTLAREVPEILRRRGPTEGLAFFLSWRRRLFAVRGAELVDIISPYLRSPVPQIAGGALHALLFLKPHYDWKAAPNMPARIDREVSRVAGQLVEARDRAVLSPLALYLGSWKTDRSRELLWRLVEEPSVREQALICLTWIGDPRDLPRLAKHRSPSLDYHLKLAYGPAADKYFK